MQNNYISFKNRYDSCDEMKSKVRYRFIKGAWALHVLREDIGAKFSKKR